MVREVLKELNRSFSKLYLPTRSPTS